LNLLPLFYFCILAACATTTATATREPKVNTHIKTASNQLQSGKKEEKTAQIRRLSINICPKLALGFSVVTSAFFPPKYLYLLDVSSSTLLLFSPIRHNTKFSTALFSP